MYLYFNNQGVLKEIVNDDAIRQGNHNINKIRFFIEGAEPQIVNNVYKAITFVTGVRTFIDVEGNQLTTESISLSTEKLEIPYDKKRELKFFKYFTKYEMFSITVPDDILNESGTVGCRVQMVSAEGIITLGLIVFNVEITTGGQAIIEPDTAINIAQWNYLISNMLTPEKYIVKYDTDANQWDVVPTEGSTKPVTSGGVQQAIANALSTVYKIQGNATTNELNSLEKSEAMTGYVYNMSNSGYLLNSDQVEVSVQEGDNVVFIWNNGEWYWDKLGGIIDTSNLVTTNTEQTITANKTIDGNLTVTGTSNIKVINPGSGNSMTIGDDSGVINFVCSIKPIYSYVDIGTSSSRWRNLYLSNSIIFPQWTIKDLGDGDLAFTYGTSNKFYLRNGYVLGQTVRPISHNTYDLGTSGVKWKDLYLSGAVNLGTDTTSLYLAKDDSDRLGIYHNNVERIKIGTDSSTYCAANWIPDTDNSYDLGSDAMRWKDLHLSGGAIIKGTATREYIIKSSNGYYLDFSFYENDALQGKALEIVYATSVNAKTINPFSNNTYNLGSTGYNWNIVYTKNLNADDATQIAVKDIGKKLYKHTIISNYQDWANMKLVIISTDSGVCSSSQDVFDLLTNRAGNLVSAHLVNETTSLLASVSGYNVVSQESLTVSCISSAGGTPSVVSGLLDDNDAIDDTVTAIN